MKIMKWLALGIAEQVQAQRREEYVQLHEAVGTWHVAYVARLVGLQ